MPPVGPRQPCPCGSGRRYKACHGKAVARAEHVRVKRPFEGLADETEWVAMRELVPAATATLTLLGEAAGRAATLSTVLPMAWPALVRKDGHVMLAAQTQTASGDLGRDLADALLQALAAPPGSPVPPRPLPATGPRLPDLVDPKAPLEVFVHSGFDYWVDSPDDLDDSTRLSLERANAAVVPTAQLASVRSAYWMALGDRVQLRWVLPEDEDALLAAFARLHDDGRLDLDVGSRYLGSFRAQGLLIPVWDLPEGTEVDDVEDAAGGFRGRLDAALATHEPLTGDQRRIRQALAARQLTLA